MKIYFCSQYRDIKNADWKHKGCSVSALWMALKSLKQEEFILTPDELLEEAINIKSFSDTGFWKHEKVSILAHNHGLAAYNEEYKSMPFGEETKYASRLNSYGVEKIFQFLKEKRGLVIASIPKNFEEINKPHSILLHDVKVKDSGERVFVYHDSEKESEEEGVNKEIDFNTFLNSWRRLAIFLNKIK